MTKILPIFTVLLLSVALSLEAQSPLKAIVGGTLVNTNGSPPLEDAVIVIEAARIVRVGASKDMPIPQGAEIIQAKGKWIIPGLIDVHVHFFQSGGLYTRPDIIDLRKQVPYEAQELAQVRARLLDTFARYVRCGITSVVDVGGPWGNFEVRDLAKKTARAPRVAVAGPLVSTYQPEALAAADPPIIKVHTVEEARALVRRQAEKQPDLIKIWFIVFPHQKPQDHLPIIKATIDESHRHGIRVAVHATELETARVAVNAGADVLVHSVFDTEVDAAFIQLLKDKDVIYTPTLMVYEGYEEVFTQQIKLTPPEHDIANPYIVSTLFDLRHLPPEDLPPHVLDGMSHPRPLVPHPIALTNLRLLHEAGVMIAAGTDAGNIGTLHGPAIFREFALMAAAGLAPMQILTAATIRGAKVMGRQGDLGTIEAGKLADMVILNADPLLDIRNTSDIDMIVKGGDIYQTHQLIQKTPEDVVQQQVNAYNARDLDAFLATYSPDIQLFTHPDNLLLSGLEQMQTRYALLFANTPNLHAEIVKRIVRGNVVIDQVTVTGLSKGQVEQSIAIYDVHDDLIQRVWLVEE